MRGPCGLALFARYNAIAIRVCLIETLKGVGSDFFAGDPPIAIGIGGGPVRTAFSMAFPMTIAHLFAFGSVDLTIAIAVHAVEMLQRAAGHFIAADHAIFIGIHARHPIAMTPLAPATFCVMGPAMLMHRGPFAFINRTIAIGVRSRKTRIQCGVEFGSGQIAVTIGIAVHAVRLGKYGARRKKRYGARCYHNLLLHKDHPQSILYNPANSLLATQQEISDECRSHVPDLRKSVANCRKIEVLRGLTETRVSSTSPAMLRELDEKTGDGSPQPVSGEPHRRTAFGWLRFILSLIILALLLRSLVVAPFNIPSRSMTPTMLVGDYLFVAKWPYGYSRYSFPFAPDLFEGRIGNGRPDRGDIIVFRSPADTSSAYIKRVIGLPGDRVQMITGELHLNGEALAREAVADFSESVEDQSGCASELGSTSRLESADDGSLVCFTPRYRESLPGGRSYFVLDAGDSTADTTVEFTVPEGHYFLMGDDRDRSADSRFPAEPGGGIGFVPEENIVGRAFVLF